MSFFIVGSIEYSMAVEIDGYYITKMNDTVYTKLYIPALYGQFFIGIQEKIEGSVLQFLQKK